MTESTTSIQQVKDFRPSQFDFKEKLPVWTLDTEKYMDWSTVKTKTL